MATAVHTLVEIVERHRSDPSSHPAVVITLNPEMVMLARRSPAFSAVVESATLVVPDGIGLVRALRRRGHPEAQRVGGADLIGAYLPEAARRDHRIALVGGAPGVAQAAGERMVAANPGLLVVATSDGRPGKATASEIEHVEAGRCPCRLWRRPPGAVPRPLPRTDRGGRRDRGRRIARLPRRPRPPGSGGCPPPRSRVGVAAGDPALAPAPPVGAPGVLVARAS